MPTVRIKNQHGYHLQTEVAIDKSKLVSATIFDTEDAFQQSFAESNAIPFEDAGNQFIPSLIEHGGKIYIEGINTCIGEPESADTPEQAINDYLL